MMKVSHLRNIFVAGVILLVPSMLQAESQIRSAVACDAAALVAAITAANANPEPDTLDLEPACVYTFTTASDIDADSFIGNSALPRITTPITINGNGATLKRVEGSPDFRLLHITLTGSVTLDDVTITGGHPVAPGGGIYVNGGTLTVTDSTVSGNNSEGANLIGGGPGGGIYISGGTLTLTNSIVSDNMTAVGQAGGGIRSIQSTVTATDCIITDNATGTTAGSGGGIAHTDGVLTITNCTFLRNSAITGGAGALNSTGTTIISGSTFTDNFAGGSGGAIFLGFGTHTITGTTISGNTSVSGGGGIHNFGTLTVIQSTISGNQASSNSSSGGGGINHQFGSLNLIDSIVSENTTQAAGGGIDIGLATATIKNTTITGNTAIMGGAIYSLGTLVVEDSLLADNLVSQRGGGIYNQGNLAAVVNSTIAGNSAYEGGGIHNLGEASLISIVGSIITGNWSSWLGGAVYMHTGFLTVDASTIAGNRAGIACSVIFHRFEQGSRTITNTIVWGNSDELESPWYGPGPCTTATVSYSDIEGGFAGKGNGRFDPLFVSPIPYASAPTSAGDYRLQPASPALDAGNNASIPADSTDLDGDSDVTEPLPFDRDGGARLVSDVVDIGAYESAPDAMPDDLLANSSFEVNLDGNKIPDGWTGKALSSDKLKCDPLKSHSGNCAFLFAGATGENAKLTQTVDISGVTFSAGDQLLLSAFLKGHPALSGKLMLTVRYAGVSEPSKVKLKLKAGKGKRYAKVIAPTLVLTGSTVESVVVTLHHKSLMGKMWADTFRLFHITASARASTRGAVLPLPALPEGMRGSN